MVVSLTSINFSRLKIRVERELKIKRDSERELARVGRISMSPIIISGA